MDFLEPINAKLIEMLGPFGPLMAVGLLGVFLILLVLPAMMQKKEDPLDKLKAASNARASNSPEALRMSKGTDKLDKYSSFLEPKDEEEYSAIRLKLIQAGYRTKSAVKTYHFSQFALGIIFLLLGVAYAILKSSTGDPSTKATIMSIVFPGMFGYYLPKWWVGKRQKARQEEMVNGFPDSLDMMLVCVEAGQSLDQSIIRVSKELKSGFPALAEEYAAVSFEMKAGKDKTQVLRDMSERCGVADISSFVTVLIQSQLRDRSDPVATVRDIHRRSLAGVLR